MDDGLMKRKADEDDHIFLVRINSVCHATQRKGIKATKRKNTKVKTPKIKKLINGLKTK